MYTQEELDVYCASFPKTNASSNPQIHAVMTTPRETDDGPEQSRLRRLLSGWPSIALICRATIGICAHSGKDETADKPPHQSQLAFGTRGRY
ncbi:hypothetical protein CEXT_457261 [Caerostris extrusa]|uniref:Uncharacterized protein n=1 Tax=Caerostris extrusa TaxID=172846 RepID=A0AAV4PTN5_CAEEX|nr:hypothetical protein CEXT_457261 [Caerostris extrusa]